MMQAKTIRRPAGTAKRLLLISLLLIATLIPFAGCSSGQTITAGLGESFTLGIGQTARITGEDLTVTFDKVLGDSRCPQGVTCIWAGVISGQVTFVREKQSTTLALNEPGLTDQAQSDFAGYQLTYNYLPYPVAGQSRTDADYRLVMTITR